ncbi:MAG: GvpL/GvpF family gas vesicle protein [Candidatus Diapherotrites archaeon]
MALGEYVYCVISSKDTPEEFNIKGMDGNPIYPLKYKLLTAIASKAVMKEYKPTDENVEIHKNVELEVMKHCSVLPVAYGMVFKSRGIVLGTVKKVYPLLWRSLKKVENKVELGIKVIVPKEKKELEKLLNKKSLDEFRKECETEFIENLSEIAVSTKKDRLFSDKLVCNQSFLVEKDKVDTFTEKVGELRNKHKSLKIQYTGPWPAHNFVNIRIMGGGR